MIILESVNHEQWMDEIDEAFATRLLKSYPQVSKDSYLFAAYLLKAARQGHLCVHVSTDRVLPILPETSGITDWQERIIQGAKDLPEDLFSKQGPLVKEGEHYYLFRNWDKESICIEHLKRLMQMSPEHILDKEQLDAELKTMILLPEQALAVRGASEKSFFILTGGPGTGKTFTAGEFVKALTKSLRVEERKSFEIALAAPTGKAAANLQKSLQRALPEIPLVGKTLHHLLGINKKSQSSTRFLSADLIIVDECSMIDSQVMASLLTAIKPGARLLLLGDKYQLPSVEIGSLFADFVDLMQTIKAYSGHFVELKQCLRTDLRGIVEFAEKVKSGLLEGLHEGVSDWGKDRNITTPKSFVEAVASEFPDYSAFLDNPVELLKVFNHFRILSPLRQGIWGVDALNNLLLKYFESRTAQGAWMAIPIMIQQNSESLGLFNGEVGVILRQKGRYTNSLNIGEMAYFQSANKDEVREIPVLLLPRFEYAYLLSVYKSQGSEFDRVLILMPEGAERFGREVFYTAITRARKSVAIFGSQDVLHATVKHSSRRLTGIKTRFKN